MRVLVIVVVLAAAALHSSGAESSPFEYAEAGPVMLWYERLQREEALSKIASFREWAADYFRLWHARGAGEDESLADVVSGTERLLSLIPERAQRLDRRIFDAVAELSKLLHYLPPEIKRDRYDVYFIGYGMVGEISPVFQNYVAVRTVLWPGESYKEVWQGHKAAMFRGLEEVGRYEIKRVIVSRRDQAGEVGAKESWSWIVCVEFVPPDDGRLDIREGDAVAFLARVPDPAYVRRMKRLSKYSGNLEPWFPDVEEPWQGLDSHALLQKLQEAQATESGSAWGGQLLFLAVGFVCGAGVSAGLAWLLMRRKRRAS